MNGIEKIKTDLLYSIFFFNLRGGSTESKDVSKLRAWARKSHLSAAAAYETTCSAACSHISIASTEFY